MRVLVLSLLLVACAKAHPDAAPFLEPPITDARRSSGGVAVGFEDWFRARDFEDEVVLCLAEVDAAKVPTGWCVEVDPPKEYFPPLGILVAGRVDFENGVIHVGYDSTRPTARCSPTRSRTRARRARDWHAAAMGEGVAVRQFWSTGASGLLLISVLGPLACTRPESERREAHYASRIEELEQRVRDLEDERSDLWRLVRKLERAKEDRGVEPR